jgi:hypothetical protein
MKRITLGIGIGKSCAASAALLGMAVAPVSRAAVTNVRLYHLGEADAGAVPLNPGNPTTFDSAGAFPATKVGLEFYHGLSQAIGLGLVPGSTLSMRFTNVDSRYEAPAVTGLSDNFGIEAYVLPQNTLDSRFFYNGGDGTPLGVLADGYGLTVSGGNYAARVGGVVTINTGVPVLPGVPVEMALVRAGGVFTVYVQDVASGTSPLAPIAVGAADKLSLGNFTGNDSPPAYSGVVDEARIFTFAPGTFNPGTDLGPPAEVPEPAVLTAGLFVGGLLVRRRSARTRGDRT